MGGNFGTREQGRDLIKGIVACVWKMHDFGRIISGVLGQGQRGSRAQGVGCRV
jgi:hypothetical protein